jgi:hypothetical protein
MRLEEITKNYIFCDGEILSLSIDFLKKVCTISLQIRNWLNRSKFQKCTVDLEFTDVFTIDISEDFRTDGRYSDITFTKLIDNKFYLSLDPYGNTGQPDNRDNFIVTANSFSFTKENGEKFKVN